MAIPPKARPSGNPMTLKKPGVASASSFDTLTKLLREFDALRGAVRQTKAPIRPRSTGVQILKGR